MVILTTGLVTAVGAGEGKIVATILGISKPDTFTVASVKVCNFKC